MKVINWRVALSKVDLGVFAHYPLLYPVFFTRLVIDPDLEPLDMETYLGVQPRRSRSLWTKDCSVARV